MGGEVKAGRSGELGGIAAENQSNTSDRYQQYRVIIPDDDQYDDSYYNFLFDNLIASSSRNFRSRFEHDEQFKGRIRARASSRRRDIPSPGGGVSGRGSAAGTTH